MPVLPAKIVGWRERLGCEKLSSGLLQSLDPVPPRGVVLSPTLPGGQQQTRGDEVGFGDPAGGNIAAGSLPAAATLPADFSGILFTNKTECGGGLVRGWESSDGHDSVPVDVSCRRLLCRDFIRFFEIVNLLL